MAKARFIVLLTSLFLGIAGQAPAHFGMVIPSHNIITSSNRSLTLTLSFSHPFDNIGMALARPKSFSVMLDGVTEDLLPTLEKTKVMAATAWQTDYPVKRPGVHHFVMEPSPYWEAAEDLSIIHYTKTIIAAFGGDEGWDVPMGLPTEIIPLTRPFGNYGGNSFNGRVLVNGRPVGSAEIEVEYYNREKNLTAPSDHHVTQVVKADENGVFTFTCPHPGWWGFAALNKAGYTLPDPQGNSKPVELGAVLWIYLDAYPSR